MKPFFSIRIEYNPADSDDQAHRDSNIVRIAVARQCGPDLQSDDDEDPLVAAVSNTRWSVVDAITSAIRFTARAMDSCDDWDLLDEVMSSLASVYGTEEAVRYLLKEVIEDTDDDFLDEIQAMIDKQRAAFRNGHSEEPDA